MDTDIKQLKEISLKNQMVPYSKENNKITFGITNIDNSTLRHELEFLLGKKVIFVSKTAEEIETGLKELYGEDVLSQYEVISHTDDLNIDQPPSDIVSDILHQAVLSRASDIHFEPSKEVLNIRYRIDGILQKGPSLPAEIKPAVISHIKILSSLDIAEKRRPQDGKFNFEYENRGIDVRVSTVPTIYGEKVVLRLLDRESLDLSLDHLGFLREQDKIFKKYIQQNQGIILVTGPTGSGKTTTLYATLNHLNRPEVNIMTVEDPIEYELSGLNQTQVHPQINYTFANALRSFLRQDPDIILVGEIRDTETAQIAIRASLTGHLVFSTLHTNSAVDTISRLIDMDIHPYLLAATLKIVVAQRLVRKICPYCKNNEKNQRCPKCRGTGYYGRLGIFELLPITKKFQEAIRSQSSKQQMEELAKEMQITTFSDAGEYYVRKGITTEEEIQRVFAENS